jgi:8-oxo-dGTP pyrophosphatase MutT (NUDIX family)
MKFMNQNIIGVGWILVDVKTKSVGIHRRDSKAPSSPNMWDYFGGGFEDGVDKNELDTLKREISEELGIIIDDGKIHELSRGNGSVVYYIDFSFNEFCQIKLGEGAGIAWITIDGALSLNDMTSKAREALSLLGEL